MRVLEYIHRPNKTEVGVGTNTNDSYLKLASALEASPIFTMNTEEVFYNAENRKNCLFKAVKYTSGGKEYRLTKLGAVKSVLTIECGDDMVFRRIEKDGKCLKQLDVLHYSKTMAYSSSKGKYTLVYPDRLPNWRAEGTAFPCKYKGNICLVTITFLENRMKRSDSPDQTALYNITIDDDIFTGNALYISLEEDIPLLEEKSKWQLNDYNVETL